MLVFGGKEEHRRVPAHDVDNGGAIHSNSVTNLICLNSILSSSGFIQIRKQTNSAARPVHSKLREVGSIRSNSGVNKTLEGSYFPYLLDKFQVNNILVLIDTNFFRHLRRKKGQSTSTSTSNSMINTYPSAGFLTPPIWHSSLKDILFLSSGRKGGKPWRKGSTSLVFIALQKPRATIIL